MGAIGAFWFMLFMGWPALGGCAGPERFWVDRLAERLVRLLKGSKLVLEVFLMSGWLMPLDMEVMSRRGVEMGDWGPKRSERLSEDDEGTVVFVVTVAGCPRSARNSKA